MYFVEFQPTAYIESIPTGLTHWLAADGEDSYFMIICSAGMKSENSLHDIKHEYIQRIIMLYEYTVFK